ncbi:VOC family protein [Phreatobacter aquaticus]|nr:VOC family protein [Phreatobacter aquaticus]
MPVECQDAALKAAKPSPKEIEMHGKFAWNELMTDNIPKAKDFYARTLGWTFDAFQVPDSEYWIAKTPDGAAVAGIMSLPPDDPEAQPGWLGYIQVDNVDQRIQAVTAAGGQLLQDPFDIPGVGRIAIIADPSGSVIGWMTPPVPQA